VQKSRTRGKKKKKGLQSQNEWPLATHIASSWKRWLDDSNVVVKDNIQPPDNNARAAHALTCKTRQQLIF